MLIGARVYRFEEEELVEIFLQCFQLLWTRLSEGTLYNHCHYMVSMIEYCRQFDESVSDFILLSSIDSISQVPTLQDRFLIFLYFVARRTIHCLAHCCSVICCMAKTMQWKMLKHYLRKISMENGYYSLRYLFRQHSWSILYKWLQKEKKTLSEFSFDLFE